MQGKPIIGAIHGSWGRESPGRRLPEVEVRHSTKLKMRYVGYSEILNRHALQTDFDPILQEKVGEEAPTAEGGCP